MMKDGLKVPVLVKSDERRGKGGHSAPGASNQEAKERLKTWLGNYEYFLLFLSSPGLFQAPATLAPADLTPTSSLHTFVSHVHTQN